MDKPDSQPGSPDAKATVDDAVAGGKEANRESEAAKAAVELKQLGEALGREFKDTDDAMKALKNLHSLVGDRSIADLRKKAESHDLFESIVSGYAEEEGLDLEEARKQLRDLAKGQSRKGDERIDVVLKEVSELRLQLQEKNFLDEHPEAKSVLKELKTIASSTGQSLSDVYQSSSLRELAVKAVAAEEKEKTGTMMRPSARQVPPSAVKEALDRFKANPTSSEAKDAYVKAAMGL